MKPGRPGRGVRLLSLGALTGLGLAITIAWISRDGPGPFLLEMIAGYGALLALSVTLAGVWDALANRRIYAPACVAVAYLLALLPTMWLPAVPGTGVEAYPTFEYGSFHRDTESSWELIVECSNGFGNWDKFVRRRSGEYPQYMHGGSVERIGDWAYVHE